MCVVIGVCSHTYQYYRTQHSGKCVLCPSCCCGGSNAGDINRWRFSATTVGDSLQQKIDRTPAEKRLSSPQSVVGAGIVVMVRQDLAQQAL